MSQPQPASGKSSAPSLADLMARFLERQVSAHPLGLAFPEPAGEVVPFEAMPVQPVDPRVAWNEALAALPYFQPAADLKSLVAPPDWSSLMAGHEPVLSVAFCMGNFPQLVRNLQPIWRTPDLGKLRPSGRTIAAPSLADWARDTAGKQAFPQRFLALGCLRLARQFDTAISFVHAQEKKVPAEWQAAWANELAALAWHRGQAAEAEALWQAQPASVPVLFNRGLAALFLNRPADARPWLTKAVAQLPEEGGWHHLGKLYLALAEMRS